MNKKSFLSSWFNKNEVENESNGVEPLAPKKQLTPKVSIIVPVFNGQDYLENFIGMIQSQTFENYELLYIDDGSTDNTPKIINRQAKNDKRVRYIYQENSGVGSARNHGLTKARGEYVIWLDVDDVYERTLIEEMLATAEKHNAQITICTFSFNESYLGEDRGGLGVNKCYFPDDICINPREIKDLFTAFSHRPANKLYKRDFIEKLDLKYSETKVGNDYFFAIAIIVSSDRVVAIHKDLMTFRRRVNETSISNERGNHTGDISIVFNQLYSFLIEKKLDKRYRDTFIASVSSELARNAGYGSNPEFIEGIAKMFACNPPWNEMEETQIVGMLEGALSTDGLKKQIAKREKEIEEGLLEDKFAEEELCRLGNRLETITQIKEKSLSEYGRNLDPCPDISIIIPVYNTFPYLDACLDSVSRAISNLYVEVILVDDGSDDGSFEKIEDYSDTRYQFNVYRVNHMGAGAARNFGVSKATGRYIAFVDSDDVVVESLFKDMLYICDANKLNMTICNVSRMKNATTGSVSGQYQRAFMGAPKLINNIENDLCFMYDGSPCNKLINLKFWNERGFSFPEGKTYEDMPVFLKLFSEVGEFGVLHSFGYYWRIRPGGDSVSQNLHSPKALRDRMTACKDMLDYLVEKYGKESPITRFMEERLVIWEFDNFLGIIHSMDKETREYFIKEIKLFFKENVSEEALTGISDFNRKKYELILSEDIDNLLRLMNHKRLSWRNVPMLVKDGEYYLKLPKDIYGKEYEKASLELQEDLPLTTLTLVEQEGSKVGMNVVVYQPRVNVENKDSQKVEAYLYNELTGEKVYVPCEPLQVKPWTKTHGELVCNDDYRLYSYNYDWAGVRLTIDFDEIIDSDSKSIEILELLRGLTPRWLLCINYSTPVLKGERILRGISMKGKETMGTLNLAISREGNIYRYFFNQDIRGTLHIEMKIEE